MQRRLRSHPAGDPWNKDHRAMETYTRSLTCQTAGGEDPTNPLQTAGKTRFAARDGAAYNVEADSDNWTVSDMSRNAARLENF